jgi:hypothetical protein
LQGRLSKALDEEKKRVAMKKISKIGIFCVATVGILLFAFKEIIFEDRFETGSGEFLGVVAALRNDLEKNLKSNVIDAKKFSEIFKKELPENFTYVSLNGVIVTVTKEGKLIVLEPLNRDGKVEWRCVAKPLEEREKRAFTRLGCIQQ